MTENLVIRPARPEDMAPLNDLYNHYVAETAVTFDVKPSTLEQRLAWFGKFGTTGPWRLLVAETGGRFSGYAGSMQFRVKEAYRTSVETSIYIHPDVQGKGLGFALYEALFVALEQEDVHRAYAGIAVPNEASVVLHERAGFRHIGTWSEVGFKLGKYQDVAWYERAVNTG